MSNAKTLFYSIDEAADKARKEREARESKEFARRRVMGDKVSKCGYRKHVNAMYHPGRCEHPDRSKENGTHLRNCLKGDCPLMK